MDFKFSITDDESELVIGFCEEVIGLTGNSRILIDGEEFHKVTLKNFCFKSGIKEYLRETEKWIELIYISILNEKLEPIGSYYFSLSYPVFNLVEELEKSIIDLELIGELPAVASQEALELWDGWRKNIPVSKNQWALLSEDERRGWLEIVRLHSFKVSRGSKDKKNETFYLDGKYVTDYAAFFCALGEAINGPGGYYGFDFPSLNDCFCGGVGAITPFTLVWKNPIGSIKSLDKEAWVREINYRSKIDSNLLEQSEFCENGDRSLFQAIMGILIDNSIRVLLEP